VRPQAALAAIDEARHWPETPVNTWLSRLHTLLGGAKTAPATDRRIAPRYKVELTISVVARGHSLRGRSCDLSQTGMGFYAGCDLDVGEHVLLQYELGDGSPPKKVSAVIRNRSGNRYGVEFGV
jgi:hypothetical protein